MTDSDISIVIPAYNEERGLDLLLARLVPLAVRKGWEVIVVDDGSTDNTESVARKHRARLAKHPYNKGYGASLKTGIRMAAGEIVITMDSDGQHKTGDIERLASFMDDYDMVVGKRNKAAGIRAPGKKVLSIVANYLSDMKIPDLNSGFRAFRKKTVKEFLHICPNGFSFSTTITLAYLRSAYSVKYVPVDVDIRVGRQSNVKFFKDGYKTFLLIIRVITLFNPLKVFIPASLFLLALGVLFTLYGIAAYGRAPNIGVLIILSSVFLFFMGVMSDQISSIRREKRLG